MRMSASIGVLIGILALAFGGSILAGANPVEQIKARVREYNYGGQQLQFYGTVDSVRYFPNGTMTARRDSATLNIFIDGRTYWPPDSIRATPLWNPVEDLDLLGNGTGYWAANVDAHGYYTKRIPIAGTPDTTRIGDATPPFFWDMGALIRMRCVAGTIADITAWGTEKIADQVTPWYADAGIILVSSDSAQVYFDGQHRVGGLRYAIRTLNRYTNTNAAGQVSVWYGVEMTRDTVFIKDLVAP